MAPQLKLIDFFRTSSTKGLKPIFKTHIPGQSCKTSCYINLIFGSQGQWVWWLAHDDWQILDIIVIKKRNDEFLNKYTNKANECWRLKSNISLFNSCWQLFCLFMHDYKLDSKLFEAEVREILANGIRDEINSFVAWGMVRSTSSL